MFPWTSQMQFWQPCLKMFTPSPKSFLAKSKKLGPFWNISSQNVFMIMWNALLTNLRKLFCSKSKKFSLKVRKKSWISSSFSTIFPPKRSCGRKEANKMYLVRPQNHWVREIVDQSTKFRLRIFLGAILSLFLVLFVINPGSLWNNSELSRTCEFRRKSVQFSRSVQDCFLFLLSSRDNFLVTLFSLFFLDLSHVIHVYSRSVFVP